MNTPFPLKFKTSEEQEELLYHLILAICDYEEKGTLSKDLKKIYQLLYIDKFAKSKEGSSKHPKINTYYEFLMLLDVPPKSWFDWGKPLSKDFSVLIKQPILFFGELNEMYYEFLLNYKEEKVNRLQHQQLTVRDFVYYCREHELNSKYTSIRNFIVENPFLSDNELNEFKLEFMDDPYLINFIQNMYQQYPITELTEITLCGYCKAPLKKKNGKFICLKPDVCDYYEKVQYRKRSNKYIHSSERWFVLKEGIHYYICLPGIEEIRLYQYLKGIFHMCTIVLYPNMDKDGDIKLIYKNHEYVIDLKDYRNEEWLFENNKAELGTKDYIYIPKHRTYNQPQYVPYLQNKLKNKKTIVGGQRTLVQNINDWIKKIDVKGCKK